MPARSPERNQPSGRVQWNLPPGVSRATWDYVNSNRIADDYDAYFEFNELFEFDLQCVIRAIGEPDSDSTVIDFGSGTGRAIVPLMKLGWGGIAVDLSKRMLQLARQKAADADLTLHCLRTNLVEMDAIDDSVASHAICLFSTLGMIRGSSHRLKMLKHVRRIVRDKGTFVLHVHNYWYNLYDPSGPWWLIANFCRSLWDQDVQRGDKFFQYRGLPQMYLHVFTKGELKRLLHQAGFSEVHFLPLHHTRQRALKLPWLFGRLRANGWMITCR